MVDLKLQCSLVGSFLMVFVLASAIYQATMSFTFLEFHAIADTLQLPPEHPLFSELERVEDAATSAFAAIFLGFTVLTIWAGLRLSRTIAGPIFALGRHFERVADGQTDADLSVREDDCFPELVKKFNHHMDACRKQLAAARAGME